MNPSAFNPYLNWLSRAHSTNAYNHHFNTCNHHYHNHSSLHTNFCFYFFWKIELKFKRSARKNCQANNQRLFDYITDYSANQMNNQDIGIKKVSRHTLRAGKSAVYAVSRLSVYYSNSTNPNQFCLEIILCRIRGAFDYLIYPYYPAYMG